MERRLQSDERKESPSRVSRKHSKALRVLEQEIVTFIEFWRPSYSPGKRIFLRRLKLAMSTRASIFPFASSPPPPIFHHKPVLFAFCGTVRVALPELGRSERAPLSQGIVTSRTVPGWEFLMCNSPPNS
jgi:hypothetical protein